MALDAGRSSGGLGSTPAAQPQAASEARNFRQIRVAAPARGPEAEATASAQPSPSLTRRGTWCANLNLAKRTGSGPGPAAADSDFRVSDLAAWDTGAIIIIIESEPVIMIVTCQ